MTVAILTTYLPVTNHRGSRLKATTMLPRPDGQKVSVTVGLYELHGNDAEKHAQVARMLVEKLGWAGRWVGGDAGGASYVFVKVFSDVQALGFTIDPPPSTSE